MRQQLSGETKSSVGPVRAASYSTLLVFLIRASDDPNDAFWLAQTYFTTHQYSRAERLLTRPFSTSPPKPPSSPPPAGLTNGHLSHLSKGKGRDLDSIPPSIPMPTPRLPMGPGGMLDVPDALQDGVSRLVDMSVACRYLAAQCQVRTVEIGGYARSYPCRCDKETGQRLLSSLGKQTLSVNPGGVGPRFPTWMAVSRYNYLSIT